MQVLEVGRPVTKSTAKRPGTVKHRKGSEKASSWLVCKCYFWNSCERPSQRS